MTMLAVSSSANVWQSGSTTVDGWSKIFGTEQTNTAPGQWVDTSDGLKVTWNITCDWDSFQNKNWTPTSEYVQFGENYSNKGLSRLELNTTDIPGTITSVTVDYVATNSTSMNMSVNVGAADTDEGVAFRCDGNESYKINRTKRSYTFKGSSSGKVTILLQSGEEGKRYIRINNIKVEYTPDTPVTRPVITAEPQFANGLEQVGQVMANSLGMSLVMYSDNKFMSSEEMAHYTLHRGTENLGAVETINLSGVNPLDEYSIYRDGEYVTTVDTKQIITGLSLSVASASYNVSEDGGAEAVICLTLGYSNIYDLLWYPVLSDKTLIQDVKNKDFIVIVRLGSPVISYKDNGATATIESHDPFSFDATVSLPFIFASGTEPATMGRSAAETPEVHWLEAKGRNDKAVTLHIDQNVMAEAGKDVQVSGIVDIGSDDIEDSDEADYTDLTGRRAVRPLAPGIYLRRIGNRVTKIRIR